MKKVQQLSPLVQEAINLVQQHSTGPNAALSGPIVPTWLPAAMPQYGQRHSHLHWISTMVLSEILSAYFAKKGEVFWRGPAYQINRADLARRFNCKEGDISRVLTFLKNECLLEVFHRARRKCGEYAGKATFALPIVPNIIDKVTEARSRSEALDCTLNGTSDSDSEALESILSGSSGHTEGHVSHNCAPSAGKATESTSVASGLESPAPATSNGVIDSDALAEAPEAQGKGHGPQSNADGAPCNTLAGEAAAPPTLVTGNGGFRQPGKNGVDTEPDLSQSPQSPSAQPVNGSKAPLSPEQRAHLFLKLYVEAIQRSGYVDPYVVRPCEKEAVMEFFANYEVPAHLLTAYAIQAWEAAEENPPPRKSDKFYHCRTAFKVDALVHNFTQIQAELKRGAYCVTEIYRLLRWYFLDAELQEMGLRQLVLNNLNQRHPVSDFWENFSEERFESYYRNHHRPVPTLES